MELLSRRPCMFQNFIDIAELTPEVVTPLYTFPITEGGFLKMEVCLFAGMTVMSREGIDGSGERTISRAVQSLRRCLGRGMSTRGEMGLDARDASLHCKQSIRKRRCMHF